jgi:predicted permease
MMEVFRNVRRALRTIPRERAFAATVLTTLALVIGANVSLFSVIHAVLLEPLPYERPQALLTLYNSYPGAGVERGANGSYDFFMRRERVDAFEEVALLQGSGSTVGDPGAAERVGTLRVTPSIFPLLHVQAALGRTFTDDEMDPGNDDKVVLTHAFWQEHFGGAEDVLGRQLRVDGRAREVVGVAPEDLSVVGHEDARFFLPLAFDEQARSADSWHSNSYQMFARLREGATLEQARTQVDALNAALIEESTIPNARQLLADVAFRTEVLPITEALVADVRPTLYLLWAGVGFVLLIGCVNIANLMLARSQRRAAELATRIALGAPRARVAREVVTEALALSAVGGVAGVGVGWAGLQMIRSYAADRLPRGSGIGLDPAVLAFTLVLAVGAGVLFAALPALDVMRRDLSGVFRAEGRSGTATRGAVLLRSGLVTAQVGLAFVLLVGAGLMLTSFRAALAVDPGFEPAGVLTAAVSLPPTRYPDADARRAFTEALLGELRALPGVDAVSLTTQLPFGGDNSSSVILPEGYEPRPGESILSPYQTRVGAGYFAALRIGVVEGREFAPTDGPDAPNVIVIDRWLARRYWPDESPLGRRMLFNAVPGDPSITEDNYATVVGVVETIKHNDVTTPESAHVGAYYHPTLQQPPGAFVLVLRAAGAADPTALTAPAREALTRLDPELPLFGVQTLDERITRSLAQRRAAMTLLVAFSAVALFLALVGIYGALAYAVSRRRREMAIRLALGSAPRDLFTLVLGQGLAVTAAGLLLGALGSVALAGVVRTLLFGVRPLEPEVLSAVAAVLGSAALLACALPAWRATRVDPVGALTSE